MGYKKDVDDGAGSIPEFGAIFMSNIATKRECLKRRIFGLPLAEADFVKQVKAGMLLFLFEFEKRQLFGVFRAISDGEIVIMTNAFKSSGKKFPAQVQFTQIWNCTPLSEHEFRDAIRDNYYSSKKFRFGLSEDQVRSLLLLFSSRKLKREFPGRRFTRDSRHIHEEKRRHLDDARIMINGRRGLEPDTRDRHGPENLNDHSRNSVERVTHAAHLTHSRGDTRQSKNTIEYDQKQVPQTRAGEFGVKITRIDSEASFLVNDDTGKLHYDGDSPRNWNEYFEESLGPGKTVDDDLFLAGHMVNDGGEMNNILESDVGREHTHNSFRGVGVANKDGYQLSEYRHDIGSGLISSEHYNNRETILADEGNFLVDNFIGRNQHDVEGQREYQRERETDSGTYFVNNLKSIVPNLSTEHMGISMGGGTRTTDNFRFSDLEKDRESNIYPVRERLKHERCATDCRGLATSTDYSRFDLVDDRRIGGGSRFRNSDMEETGNDQLGISRGHVNISPSRISKSTYTGNPCFQTEISSPLGRSSLLRYLEDCYIPHVPRSISQDATRAVPYDPELPDIYHGHSSSIAVGHGSSPVKDLPFYQGSKVSPSSSHMTVLSPYQFERRSSGRYFDTPGYGNAHSFPSHHEASYRKSNASIMDGYSESSELINATQEGFNVSFYSDPSAHLPLSKVETTENNGDGPLTNSLFSSTKCGYDAGSRGKHSYSAGKGTNAEGLSSFNVGRDKMQSGGCFSEAPALPCEDPIDQDRNFSRSSQNKVSYTNNRRKSVFARLTSAPEARMLDQDDDIDALSDANDMDTSVEEVMAMLLHGASPQVKIRNNKVIHKQQDDKGMAKSKRLSTSSSDKEFEHLKLKMKEHGSGQTIEDVVGSILEETRHVNFKRRNKATKNVETVSFPKRRRLVRPVFGKKESEEGVSSYDVNENLQSTSHENSLKEKESNNQEVVATEGCSDENLQSTSHENSLKEKESNNQEVVATEGCELSDQVADPASRETAEAERSSESKNEKSSVNVHENSLKEKESNNQEVVATEGCELSDQVADPASRETAEAERSSECKNEKSSVNVHSPSRCPEGECSNDQPTEALISTTTDSCTRSLKCCGWIEC